MSICKISLSWHELALKISVTTSNAELLKIVNRKDLNKFAVIIKRTEKTSTMYGKKKNTIGNPMLVTKKEIQEKRIKNINNIDEALTD